MEKTILIQGAMKVELEFIKNKLKETKEIKIDGYNFIIGNLENYKIVLSETKIGTMNSAVSTYIGIKNFNPTCIINQGVSGGGAKNIHKNDLVIGTECVNVNSYETKYRKEEEGSNPFEWKIMKFTSDDDIEEKKDNFIESDKTLLNKVQNIKKIYKNGSVHFGVLGSGDVWNQETDRILWLNKELKTISADMESIGAYTIADKYNVPVIGIRVISDNSMLEEDYERNVAHGAQEFVFELVKELIKE